MDAIASRVEKLEAGTSNAQPPKTPWASFWPIVATFVTACVALIGTVLAVTVHIDSELSAIRKDATSLGQRTDHVEAAIKALSSQQSDQTQKLVHDLLAVVKQDTKPESVSRVLATAGSLVDTLQKEKRQAGPQFFLDGITAMNQIDQERGYLPIAFDTRIRFAEYRSAIESIVPGWWTKLVVVQHHEHLQIIPGHQPHLIDGMEIDLSLVTGNALELGDDKSLKRNVVVHNSRFDGGYQILDGIHWNDVYFVGTRIQYDGGEVDLRNVHFINCTFEVPQRIAPTSRARQVIDYAALVEPELKLTGE
jgi:hypothetical protein